MDLLSFWLCFGTFALWTVFIVFLDFLPVFLCVISAYRFESFPLCALINSANEFNSVSFCNFVTEYQIWIVRLCNYKLDYGALPWATHGISGHQRPFTPGHEEHTSHKWRTCHFNCYNCARAHIQRQTLRWNSEQVEWYRVESWIPGMVFREGLNLTLQVDLACKEEGISLS